MMRITQQSDGEATTLKVEGCLAGEWVGEMKRCWDEVEGATHSSVIRMDLTEVTFIDAAGRQLLAEMIGAGVTPTATNIMTKEVIREIACTAAHRASHQTDPQRKERTSKEGGGIMWDRKQTAGVKFIVGLVVAVTLTLQGVKAKAQSAAVDVSTPLNNQAQAVANHSGNTGQTSDATALSLQQAIQFAIDNNLNTKLARERRNESLGQKMQALAFLLPNVAGTVSQSNNTVNLAAQGLTPKIFPVPTTFIGPFSSFDARFQFAQSLFNLSSIRNFQAAKANTELTNLQEKLARQQVASLASLAYLNALRSQRDVETAQANLDLAKSLFTLANNQKTAGIATGVDVTRAETRQADQEVRLAEAQTNAQTAILNLLRIAGLPLNSRPVLTDALRYRAQAPPVVEVALQTAAQDRVEIAIAEQEVKQQSYERKAAQAELYPSIEFFANYGSSGVLPSELALPTRSVGVRMNVPIFNGGATYGRIKSAKSRETQSELRLNDTREQVEQDVRNTLQTLATAAKQVASAEQQVKLAERELEQSRDRFSAGVGDNIEVLNAQTALENARNAQVAALTAYNSARINLAAALGKAEEFRW
ncbi:MAG: TolC family protein [Acidobacteria bacterium]|nr:TolC family protein [Acidobacteriota bacterium]